MIAPVMHSIPDTDLATEARELFRQDPFLAHQNSETVSRALRMLRGVEVYVFIVEDAMEILRLEREVLA